VVRANHLIERKEGKCETSNDLSKTVRGTSRKMGDRDEQAVPALKKAIGWPTVLVARRNTY